MTKVQAISHLKQIAKQMELMAKTAEQLHNYIVEIEAAEQARTLLKKVEDG